MTRLGLLIAAAIVAFSCNTNSAHAQTSGAPICGAPAEFSRLGLSLRRVAKRLASGEPIKVVAVGSSSTAGAGASSPANAYPAKLEADLKARFPGVAIAVLNRGVNGEDAKQMLARFDEQVIGENPDLVLWQVGTNAVLRDHNLAGEAPLIRDGIRRLKVSGADVVLVDSQYAPKVLAKPDIEGMIKLVGAEAKMAGVGLFQRFAIMRHWRETQGVPFEALLSPDGLHMNDWSYGCVARLLGSAIADAVRSPAVAGVPLRR
jgi:acyl-CoA thioesterase I